MGRSSGLTSRVSGLVRPHLLFPLRPPMRQMLLIQSSSLSLKPLRLIWRPISPVLTSKRLGCMRGLVPRSSYLRAWRLTFPFLSVTSPPHLIWAHLSRSYEVRREEGQSLCRHDSTVEFHRQMSTVWTPWMQITALVALASVVIIIRARGRLYNFMSSSPTFALSLRLSGPSPDPSTLPVSQRGDARATC